MLVTETSAPIWGYNAELERAMIIGQPTDEMRRLFDHTVAVQQVAFDAVRPGATCADVDGAVMRYFEQNDLVRYWRQHTGHAIGLRNHEAPFLDVGDHTPLEPGMVFTIEPGLYDADDRRLPSLGHRGRHRGRSGRPHRLPERHREPHVAGLTRADASNLRSGDIPEHWPSRPVPHNSRFESYYFAARESMDSVSRGLPPQRPLKLRRLALEPIPTGRDQERT